MANKEQNIAALTLKAKIKDLDALEERIDDAYAKDKKIIADQKRQLNKALELINVNERDIEDKPRETRGRKAEAFDPHNYPYEGTFFNKLLFAIYNSRRFVHVREIADFIIRKEAAFDTPGFIDLVGRRVWKLKHNGKIVQYKEGTSLRNIVYGMPDWLDTNGKIKRGYENEDAALIDKRSAPDMFATYLYKK